MEVKDCRVPEPPYPSPESAKTLFYEEIMKHKWSLTILYRGGSTYNSQGDVIYRKTLAELDEVKSKANDTIAFKCLPRHMAQQRSSDLLREIMEPIVDFIDDQIPGGFPEL